MLCAECLRCGRRSILGGKRSLTAPAESDERPPVRLRCDMCGGRRVRVVTADGPAAMVAFIAGRG